MVQLLAGILYSYFIIMIPVVQKSFPVLPVMLFLCLSVSWVLIASMGSAEYFKLKTIIQMRE